MVFRRQPHVAAGAEEDTMVDFRDRGGNSVNFFLLVIDSSNGGRMTLGLRIDK